MMLKGGDDHLVTSFEEALAVAEGHQIDRLGGAAGEDDLPRLAGIEESGDAFPGSLEGQGGALAEPVYAAVDVGVLALVGVFDRVDDDAGLLSAGGAVEEHQPLAMYRLCQDREVAADALRIQDRHITARRTGDGGGHVAVLSPT